jgi:predicted enzyme related to lactoylglutathione lyase
MQRNPVVWFEIYVQDMQRARNFYESVLAIKLEILETPEPSVTEMWSFPMQTDAAGAPGALVKMADGTPAGNGTIVYFGCKDCAVEASRAPASGGKIMKNKFSIGEHGYIALVGDTEGNTIGLYSM